MKYFTLEELAKSAEATKKNINNTPNSEASMYLRQLVDNVLDPLREKYGKPIIVNSGYRCPKLNNLVGGSSTSQHVLGLAADIESYTRTREENRKLFELIREMKLPFDLLINEFNYDWIHVSYSSRHRRLVLEAKKINGRTYYSKMA